MSNQTFTPGKWAVAGDRDEDSLCVVQESTGGLICYVESTTGYATADELNAQLIAAAPDLYAALLSARARIHDEREIIFRSNAIPDDNGQLSIEHAEDMARWEVQGLDALLEIIDGALNKAVPNGRS